MAKFLILCKHAEISLLVMIIPEDANDQTVEKMVKEWVTEEVVGYNDLYTQGGEKISTDKIVEKLLETDSNSSTGSFWQVSDDGYVSTNKRSLAGLYEYYLDLSQGDTAENWTNEPSQSS